MNGKMNLKGVGMSELGKHTPGNALRKTQVKIVQPKPKGMGTASVTEPIVGCCGVAPMKMAGKK